MGGLLKMWKIEYWIKFSERKNMHSRLQNNSEMWAMDLQQSCNPPK